MKKTLCLLLAALTVLVALTACGETAKTDDTTVAEATTEAATVDINAKDEGVLTYAQFVALESGKDCVIEGFLQAKYDYASAYGNTSLYLCDGEGAYFVYRYSCTQEQYDALVVGNKYKITGLRGEYAGEVEVTDVTALEVVGTDTYTAEALDITATLASETASNDMNKFVTIKGAEVVASTVDSKDYAFLYKYNGSGTQGDDLYFNIKVDGNTYTFCVESDFCNKDTEVYKAVEALKIGDKIDLTGFLYWYNAAQMQVTAVAASK